MSANLRTFKKGESRFYVDDSTGATAPGVTSILNMLPKGFLQFWAAKMTAECAVDNIQSVVGLAMNDRQGAIDYLKGAARRSTKEAADFGTSSHDLFERMARGENVGRIHPELRVMAQHFQEFLDDVQPEFLHLEQTVWNDNPSFAGSFDATKSGGEPNPLVGLANLRHKEGIWIGSRKA